MRGAELARERAALAAHVALRAERVEKFARVVESFLRDGKDGSAEKTFGRLDAEITALWDARERLRRELQASRLK